MEYTNASWEPPDDWASKVTELLSTPSARAHLDQIYASESALLDIVVHSSQQGAQLIVERHRLVSMLDEWTDRTHQVSESVEALSSKEAEAAVLRSFESHFATAEGAAVSTDIVNEGRGEYQIRVDAGTESYSATAIREPGHLLTHLVKLSDL